MGRKSMLTAGLGAIGWLVAGPLVATLLVGRTGILFPSLTWLGVAAGTWLWCAAIGWLAGAGPGLPGDRQTRMERLAGHAGGAGRALVLTAAAAPLLPLLYVDDHAFHVAAGEPGAPRAALAGLVLLLAVAGGVATALFGGDEGRSACTERSEGTKGERGRVGASAQRDGRDPGPPPGSRSAVGGERRAQPAYVLVPAGAVLAMIGLNRGLLLPLADAEPMAMPAAALVALNLVCLGAAALATAWYYGLVAGTVAAVAWLAFAPFAGTMGASWLPGPALLAGTSAVLLVSSGRFAAASVLLGLSATIVPAALGGLAALAAGGRWRPAVLGFVVAAAGLGGRLASGHLAVAALRDALWSTPHAANVALGGAFARLFAGPGALAEPMTERLPAPVATLTIGSLLVGVWLVARAARRTSQAPDTLAAVAVLGVLAWMALAGTTPAVHLSLAGVAALPWLNPRPGQSWRGARRRAVILFAISGYVLAGTSLPALNQAGAGLFSQWPLLASLPALGVIGLVVAVGALVHDRCWRGA